MLSKAFGAALLLLPQTLRSYPRHTCPLYHTFTLIIAYRVHPHHRRHMLIEEQIQNTKVGKVLDYLSSFCFWRQELVSFSHSSVLTFSYIPSAALSPRIPWSLQESVFSGPARTLMKLKNVSEKICRCLEWIHCIAWKPTMNVARRGIHLKQHFRLRQRHTTGIEEERHWKTAKAIYKDFSRMTSRYSISLLNNWSLL